MEIDLISGDKPHSCELCSKKFALACNLRAHMKTHEGKFCEQNIFLVWATSFYYLLLINKSYNLTAFRVQIQIAGVVAFLVLF